MAGKARCINVLGPSILVDKFAKPLRTSFPSILFLSCIITHPIRHPGTKNLFVSPLQVNTGTSLDNDEIAVNSFPENTKCSYISSAMIGTRFLEAISNISFKCSLLYTDPQGFDGFITMIAAVFSSI